jgi:hypothetical protein
MLFFDNLSDSQLFKEYPTPWSKQVVDWLHLAQDRDQLLILVNVVMNF